MLDAQNAHGPFAIDNRNTGERVEFLLARFGPILEIRMRFGLGEVERRDVLRDGARQPFTDSHAGDMDSLFIEAACREQFQHPFAQEVYRHHLAIEVFGNDIDHAVQFALRMHARGHDLVQLGQDQAGGVGCCGHRADLPERCLNVNRNRPAGMKKRSGCRQLFLNSQLFLLERLDCRSVGHGSGHFFAKLGFDSGMFVFECADM